MGSITLEQIEAVLRKQIAYKGHADGLPQAPGMQLRHYAPQTPMVVTYDVNAVLEKLM